VKSRSVRSIGALAAVAVVAGACGTHTLDTSSDARTGAAVTSSSSPKTAVENSLQAITTAPSYTTRVTVGLSGLGALMHGFAGASMPSGPTASMLRPILQGKALQITIDGGYSRSLNAVEMSFAIPGFGTEAAIVDGSAHLGFVKLPPAELRLMEQIVRTPAPFGAVPPSVKALVREISAHPGDWLKVDLSKLGRSSQLPAGLLSPTSMQTASFLKTLEAAITSASVVGASSVGGVAVTEYKATLDLATAASSLVQKIDKSSPALAPVAPFIGKMSAGLPKSLPFDVYVDHSGYARRIAATIALGPMLKGLAGGLGSLGDPTGLAGTGSAPNLPAAAGKGLSQLALTVSADFAGFGAANDVVLPPANQVIDITPALARAPKSFAAI
jgi:hypothetical protein